MQDERIDFFISSFKDLQQDIDTAILNEDSENINLHFLRLFRLLNKVEEFFTQSIQAQQWKTVVELQNVNILIQENISDWERKIANTYETNGEDTDSERERLASLSFRPAADDYFQYAHSVLKSKSLFVNKDIEENIALVHPANVKDIMVCLKRAKLAVRSASGINGMLEPYGYFLSWIDLMEQAIKGREDLQIALTTGPEEITLDVALKELEQLIGLQTVKRKVTEISNWVTFTKMRKEQGLKADEISLHMVFSGNPGTGKTTVARIIAKIFKALGVLKQGHLVEVGRSDLVAEFVGQTAVKTMNVIKEAEHGVLFIDEAYSLTRSGGNDFGIEAIDTLVKAMEDNRNNLVVILAGYPAEMKNFIQANPGLYSRFKYHIDFPDYSLDELLTIHQVLLKQKQYKLTDSAEQIAKRIINKKMQENPNQHGNGRMIRNMIEDEILNKAAYVVERKEKELPIEDLDLIDETIMRMVEFAHIPEVIQPNMLQRGRQ